MMLTNVNDMTNVFAAAGPAGTRRRRQATDARTVLIVNGGNRMSDLLETAVDAGQYDVVFVEAVAHAYSQIRKIQPDLVIISIRMDDVDGLRVLSMLKLDPDTRRIPVITCTSEEQDASSSDEDADDDEPDEMFAAGTDLRMN
ncbi:MAG: PleD family two-component system response regulator [Vicinamibacterales bacterium]